jgi:protein ImuB
MLWIGLHLPWLPLELFTRGAAAPEPLAVCDDARDPRVVIANDAAQRRGIHAGMRLAAALALAADLDVRRRDETTERAALERLAAWAGQFTSLVSIATRPNAAPDTLLLDIEGSLALFGGLAPLTASVRAGIAALGYRAHCAVAPTPLAAEWLARAGAAAAVTDGAHLAGALAPLPLGCTALAPQTIGALADMGIHRIGRLAQLPRGGLARRFGKDTALLLDRALGRLPDPRKPYVAPETFDAQMPLPAALDNTEALLFPLNRLLLELAGFLLARGAGAQELLLRLHHPKQPATDITLTLTAPTREARHLGELYRERLARTALPEPVEALTLHVRKLFPLDAHHLDFFEHKSTSGESGAALVERLQARLGHDAVRGIAQVAEHRPEYAWRYTEPGAVNIEAHFPPRPLWLLPQPLALRSTGDTPQLDGPLMLLPERERIESGWWDGPDIARDYYIARDDCGAQFWIYRELTGERSWFLHGIFG